MTRGELFLTSVPAPKLSFRPEWTRGLSFHAAQRHAGSRSGEISLVAAFRGNNFAAGCVLFSSGVGIVSAREEKP